MSSLPTKVYSGVPQDLILAPLLFSVYMDQLITVEISQETKILLYAEDILMYKPTKSAQDLVHFPPMLVIFASS